ncbi:hypothetical protein AAG570_005638 [Ranatra chinensis]|uniref:DUF4485 domain-containing protein n=1 Tax=Ranatra chinensis TaxID=642074 RepID=A0ABD0YD00_9HEMI
MEEVKVYSERIAANLGCFHDEGYRDDATVSLRYGLAWNKKYFTEDRGSILCWLERLNRCPKDEEEAGRLAEYARYLNHVIANGRIHYPFTDPPPCRKLPPLQEYFRVTISSFDVLHHAHDGHRW